MNCEAMQHVQVRVMRNSASGGEGCELRTVLGSLRALRRKDVPIAFVPLPLPASESGGLPSFSFWVP